MKPAFEDRPSWVKSRGYLHITPKIDVFKRYDEIFSKVNDEGFVARHGFFPLIHSVIKERKYKKLPDGSGRGHSYLKDGKWEKTAKQRPLHYATHIDALIYGRYAEKLLGLYEEELADNPGLGDCIIAYRKILEDIDEQGTEPVMERATGKSTIHFASEAFQEIKTRAKKGCVVLMFDIKSFFSELNHGHLKKAWRDLLGEEKLPPADFNVFRSATEFRYILRDELRAYPARNGKRAGFDEKKLASIRKLQGIEAFYGSVQEFKKAIKEKKIRVYKHPFMKEGRPVGIPQGLPISAVLANLYLLEFDKSIFQNIVDARDGYYRRYSDDIMIICRPDEAREMEEFVMEEIKKSQLVISKEKTETFMFKDTAISPRITRVTAHLIKDGKVTIGKPLTYLGFEFYGDRALIKSANLSKYYRRMVSSVKRKSGRSSNGGERKVLFPRQIKKIYEQVNLSKEKVHKNRKRLVKNENGFYAYQFKKIQVRPGGSYISYARRASEQMEDLRIMDQVRKNKVVFRKAMARHLRK